MRYGELCARRPGHNRRPDGRPDHRTRYALDNATRAMRARYARREEAA